jgi:hypothetical protein
VALLTTLHPPSLRTPTPRFPAPWQDWPLSISVCLLLKLITPQMFTKPWVMPALTNHKSKSTTPALRSQNPGKKIDIHSVISFQCDTCNSRDTDKVPQWLKEASVHVDQRRRDPQM